MKHHNGEDLRCSGFEGFEDFEERWHKYEKKFDESAKQISDINKVAKMLEGFSEIKQDVRDLKVSTEQTQTTLINTLTSKRPWELGIQLASMLFLGGIVIVLLLKDSKKDLNLTPHGFSLQTHDSN